MMKIIRKSCLCLFWAGTQLLFAGSLQNSGSAFLKIGLGSRAVGMGGAFVAVADNSNAIFWNPAGLIQLENSHFIFTHLQWFQQVHYEALSGAQVLSDKLTFGLGLQFLHTSGIERRFTANDIEPVNTFSSGQFAAKIALAGRLPAGLAWGVAGNLIQQQIDDQNAFGSGLDVGLFSNFTNSGFRAGMVLQHLGSQIKFVDEAFDLPLTFRFGASKKMIDNIWLLSGQSSLIRNFRPRYQIGSEVHFEVGEQPNLLAIFFRMGYQWRSEESAQSGYSAGVGLKFPLANIKYALDYAYQPYGLLGETHHFSLNVQLNREFKVDVHARPARFSPNDDGKLDQTDFSLVVKNLKLAKNWKLTILNPEKYPVKIFAGNGFPPASIDWNGRDDAENVLPDGRYFYILHVTRGDGRLGKSALKSIIIDLQGPLVDVFARPDYILLNRDEPLPPIRFELAQYRRIGESEMDHLQNWQLDIFDKQQRILKSFAQQGPLPEVVTWEHQKRDPSKKVEMVFIYKLSAWDFWGNQSQSPEKQITIKQEDGRFSRRYQFTIDNVMFDTDRATLRPDGIAALQQVVRVLQAHPGSYVHVEGHTDSRGTPEHNMALSLSRANTVGLYLMQQAQIPSDHITIVPYGETRPRATNSSESGMQLNRRVELYIFVKDTME